MWSWSADLCSKPSSPQSNKGELTWEGKIVLQALQKSNSLRSSSRILTLSLKSNFGPAGVCASAELLHLDFYSCMIGALIKSGERDGARVSPLCPSHFRHPALHPGRRRPVTRGPPIRRGCKDLTLFSVAERASFYLFLEQKNPAHIYLACPGRGFALLWHFKMHLFCYVREENTAMILLVSCSAILWLRKKKQPRGVCKLSPEQSLLLHWIN